MVERRARHPRLMTLDDPPAVIGQRCTLCGRRAFPPDPYGCEQCGADPSDLEPVELAATGVVHALATVHRHHHPKPATPFTVATIVLDAGVTLKAMLVAGDRADGPVDVEVGDRVVGVAVPWEVDDEGAEVVDLRFTPASGPSSTSTSTSTSAPGGRL